MNKSFITALITKNYKSLLKNKDQLIVKLLLKVPSITSELAFCNLQAYGFGTTADKISQLCVDGDYLFLEGSLWISTNTNSKIQSNDVLSLLLIVNDIQPVF
uniref:Putative single-stranded DNA binding protein n=1 Tax=Apophlaea sinclairii TaxID=212746 RepID=A0A1C9CBM4_9FLOR|nr:putative single-stranded DNA binding protein [Apophlaea sinclairii]AOM65777.1 putative single-stranded DNA binding protein [Apophlaea sinclairii]